MKNRLLQSIPLALLGFALATTSVFAVCDSASISPTAATPNVSTTYTVLFSVNSPWNSYEKHTTVTGGSGFSNCVDATPYWSWKWNPWNDKICGSYIDWRSTNNATMDNPTGFKFNTTESSNASYVLQYPEIGNESNTCSQTFNISMAPPIDTSCTSASISPTSATANTNTTYTVQFLLTSIWNTWNTFEKHTTVTGGSGFSNCVGGKSLLVVKMESVG